MEGKLSPPNLRSYTRAMWAHWFTAMSGPLSVPAAIAALWVPSDTAKILLGFTAFACLWSAGYGVWKYERQKVIDLEAKLEPSKKQAAIDELSEEISWAIHNLLNRNEGQPWTSEMISPFEADLDEWYEKISKKLGNRDLFTRTEQLHFDRLGFVVPVRLSGINRLDHLLSMLRMKIERLREIIGWHQAHK